MEPDRNFHIPTNGVLRDSFVAIEKARVYYILNNSWISIFYIQKSQKSSDLRLKHSEAHALETSHRTLSMAWLLFESLSTVVS